MGRITINPSIMDGKPCFAGTRIPVDLVIQKLILGVTVDELLREYPRLGREDLERVEALVHPVGTHAELAATG